MNVERERVPVILDTDIGDDIDDSWALSFLLKCPEVDLRYVLTATGDTEKRARLAARLLQAAGREDIPVGIGVETAQNRQALCKWLGAFERRDYCGRFVSDGVGGLLETVHASEQSPVLLSIGPMTNLGEALARDPSIAGKCHLAAMSGSICRHEDGREGQIAEWNVRHDIEAARRVYSAPWKSIRIAPLDSCGILRLNGDHLQRVRKSNCGLVRSLMESVDYWSACVGNTDWPVRSSILFDTVAAYLCFGTDYLRLERMNLCIDEEGFMREGSAAVDCAVDWSDLEGFKNMLADRLAKEN